MIWPLFIYSSSEYNSTALFTTASIDTSGIFHQSTRMRTHQHLYWGGRERTTGVRSVVVLIMVKWIRSSKSMLLIVHPVFPTTFAFGFEVLLRLQMVLNLWMFQ